MARLIKGRLIVAVDFDGTITTEADLGSTLELREDCRRVIENLYNKGAEFILWTCRDGEALDEAVEFLGKNRMFHFFSSVNNQLPEIEERYSPHVAKKVGVDVYIDDKNLENYGREIDWLAVEENLLLILDQKEGITNQ